MNQPKPIPTKAQVAHVLATVEAMTGTPAPAIVLAAYPKAREARQARHAAKVALKATKPSDDRLIGERLKAMRSATTRALSIETGRQLQSYGEG